MGIECDLIEEKKLGTNRNWDLVNAHGKQCEIEATKKKLNCKSNGGPNQQGGFLK
jgi:hypothetical protein